MKTDDKFFLTMMVTFMVAFNLVFSSSCHKDFEGRGRGSGKGKRGKNGEKELTVPVRTEILKTQNLPQKIEVVSVLTGQKQADVYSRVGGKISYIGPEEGHQVKEGQVLFRIDRSDPGETFLATPVLSPISGWVGRWLVTNIGTQVLAQQPIVTVVDDDRLKTIVQLPTDKWPLVSDKTPVHVYVGKEKRKAKVIGIARAAESTSSRGSVTLEIQNEDHLWKSGMVVTVEFELDYKQRLVLPATSLSITDQGPFVFVVKENVSHRTPVKFTVIDNDRVEVIEGLSPGLEVITEGVKQVGDGLPVHVVNSKD